MKNKLSVFFENINLYLDFRGLQYAIIYFPQQGSDITLKIKDIFVFKLLIRIEFVLDFMLK
jgi:hypothetical protein